MKVTEVISRKSPYIAEEMYCLNILLPLLLKLSREVRSRQHVRSSWMTSPQKKTFWREQQNIIASNGINTPQDEVATPISQRMKFVRNLI